MKKKRRVIFFIFTAMLFLQRSHLLPMTNHHRQNQVVPTRITNMAHAEEVNEEDDSLLSKLQNGQRESKRLFVQVQRLKGDLQQSQPDNSSALKIVLELEQNISEISRQTSAGLLALDHNNPNLAQYSKTLAVMDTARARSALSRLKSQLNAATTATDILDRLTEIEEILISLMKTMA